MLTTFHSAPSPALFCVTKTNKKQPKERFLDCFIFLPVDGDTNAALGSVILGDYVYIVKFILPNQETVSSERPFSKRSLRLNQRWEDLGMWQRGREILFSSLWHRFTPSSLLLAALFAPLIRRLRERHQEQAEVLRGSFPTLHTNFVEGTAKILSSETLGRKTCQKD